MTYSCDTQPRPLPIIQDECLIINQGKADIILGDDARMIIAYGTHIVPGASVLYDLSQPRWICSSTGAQQYDLLPGGGSAIPGAINIAQALVDSGLASDIATQVVASSLASDVATQVLATGTKVVDVPTVIPFGPIDGQGFPFTGSQVIDITDAQSMHVAFTVNVISASNLSAWGALNFLWYDNSTNLNQIDMDTFEVACPSIITPGTLGASSTGYVSVPAKGGAFQVQFQPTPVPGGSSRIQVSGIIVKSYRLAPITKYTTDNSADRILGKVSANGLAAGAGSGFTWVDPYDGPLEINADCSSVSTGGTYLVYGWGSTVWPVVTTPGRQNVSAIFFPNTGAESYLSAPLRASSRRPLWIRFHNGEAAGRDFSATVLCSTLA